MLFNQKTNVNVFYSINSAKMCLLNFLFIHYILKLADSQGDRMSVHYLVGTHNPAINTFSRNSGFIKQRFRLLTMLSFVGSFYSMFRDMCLK
jgi:hypothetical protein